MQSTDARIHNGDCALQARSPNQQLESLPVRILWLKTELLHPVDKGGKIRTYYMLKELKRNHAITYLTLDDGTAGEQARELAKEYCNELVCIPHRPHAKFTFRFYVDLAFNLVSSLPYAIKKYESELMRRELTQRIASGAFDVIVSDFLVPAVNIPHDLPCAAVLFQHNVEAMIWRRHYEVQTNPAKRAYLYGQLLKMRSFEQEVCRRFDCVVAVSREDCETMQREYGLESIFSVPTGVDTSFFRPSSNKQVDPHSLVFTGSMDWLPNEDAIKYFTEQILPLVRQKMPNVTLTVVGRNPYPGLLELGKRDSSITVTGRVEDVRPYIEQAAAYVVPLRIGGGTRLKIYEAMALEKAIVSTTIGAEGLPLESGTHLLLADEPAKFAEAVVRVLSDKQLATGLGRRAAATVREQFGWDRAAGKFEEICAWAVQGKAPSKVPKLTVTENLEAIG
jgi:sugar transferase (PEP-CTERM/EpsH1 system associated)